MAIFLNTLGNSFDKRHNFLLNNELKTKMTQKERFAKISAVIVDQIWANFNQTLPVVIYAEHLQYGGS